MMGNPVRINLSGNKIKEILEENEEGKILIVKNGEWEAKSFAELMEEDYGITKDDLLMVVKKLNEI